MEAAMEAILFASGEPVNIDRICLALELDPYELVFEDGRDVAGK